MKELFPKCHNFKVILITTKILQRVCKRKSKESKDLDYCQKALDKMDDIDRSSASRKTPWLFKKINMIENLPFV